jgi:CubicO group peptidase (beta-lactamase class C family)
MALLAMLFGALLQAAATEAPPTQAAQVAPVFHAWTAATPGCAVGVEHEGRTVVAEGFGMADLEHQVPNRADTIFEAGSVSKQFTAAAVLLLARDGRFALDDPIRRYLPELPEAAAAVTIRQMLQHTSGLRDWGSVAGIAGWPRTSRVHTHAHVLDILSRQRALNFAAGTRWSYSNSGYNLAAMLVERVSGLSLRAFSQQRLFGPLGMTRTSWRDDHTRVVAGRAQAYVRREDGYHLQMPFENAYGNGGLLTTVGDLLRWARHFRAPLVGDAALLAEQVTPGRFADGRPHDYGLGVWVGAYRGWPEVRHSGSTAGYRAYLTTFPSRGATVAVLCNASDASAETLAYRTVDAVFADALAPPRPVVATHRLTPAEMAALAGWYRREQTGEAVRVLAEGEGLRVVDGPVLRAQSSRRFLTDARDAWVFGADGAITVTDTFGTVTTFSPEQAWSPSAAELAALAGRYHSDDAEASLVASVEDGGMVLRQRPDRVIRLSPAYRGAFTSALGTVRFVAETGSRPASLVVTQERVWALPFVREPR